MRKTWADGFKAGTDLVCKDINSLVRSRKRLGAGLCGPSCHPPLLSPLPGSASWIGCSRQGSLQALQLPLQPASSRTCRCPAI